MKTSQRFLAGIALGTGLLFALPGLAQADPRIGVNLSFGVPVYDAPAYVYAPPRPAYIYAPPRPAYIYAPPRVVYYDRGYDGRNYDRWDDRRHWRGHDHGRWDRDGWRGDRGHYRGHDDD